MRRLVLCIALICVPHLALPLSALICAGPVDNKQCFAAVNYSSPGASKSGSSPRLFSIILDNTLTNIAAETFAVFQASNMCSAVADYPGHSYVKTVRPLRKRAYEALNACRQEFNWPVSRSFITFCDGSAAKVIAYFPHLNSAACIASSQPTTYSSTDISPACRFDSSNRFFHTRPPLLFCFYYAFRTSIINFIVQGNLPTKLPVYGEDTGPLQTHSTDELVRPRCLRRHCAARYDAPTASDVAEILAWACCRVRQLAPPPAESTRRNAPAVGRDSEAGEHKRKDAAVAVGLAMLNFLFLFCSTCFRALFSFLFGFLFIRVTIAKLVRGKLIESKDLVLVLQAKQAVEDSTKYLREYLITANTFDGREEMFEPE